MICPKCGSEHIDEREGQDAYGNEDSIFVCLDCGYTW